MEVKAIIFDWGRTLWDNDNNCLFPETKNTLSYLQKKGYRMSLLTVTENTSVKLKQTRIQNEGLEDFFDTFVFCKEKGETEINEINASWNLSYNDIVVVGDKTQADVHIANKLGMKSIWVKKGKFAKELPNKHTGQPTLTISRLNELKDIL